MSLARIGNQNSTIGYLHWPSYGSWRAQVQTDSDILLSGNVTVTIGDLVMSGTVVSNHSGISGALGFYEVRGALAWDTVIEERSYQSDAAAGVRLRTLIIDAANDAGVALASIDYPTDARTGSAWMRRLGMARSALSALADAALCPPWYVSPAGRTIFAARSSGLVSAPARVKRRAPALGITYLRVDDYAPWVPGLDFEGATIGSVRFNWAPNDATVDLSFV